jgi:hypothetical protein
MPKTRFHPEYPMKGQLFVSACEYYRQRADVERGLQRRDFPSLDEHCPIEKKQEKLLNEGKPPPPKQSRPNRRKDERRDR